MVNFEISVPRAYSKIGRLIRLQKIKDLVLGKNYDLSVALLGEAGMRRAQKLSRHKKHANVLSFCYSKNSGEVLLNIPHIRIEAKKLGQLFKNRLAYLYIHALLHLKGYDHKKPGDERKMLGEEKRYMKKSGF